MPLTDLPIKSEYRSPQNNIATEFLIPVLQNAVSYKRSVGFFSSSALIEISKGICALAKSGGTIELVASPYLSAQDEEAIRLGYENRNKIIENALLRELKTEHKEVFAEERLNLLANLIESGTLNIKIAFKENGIYHEKLGLIEDSDGNKIAFSGSMNESLTALKENYETTDVFCSWKNDVEKERVMIKEKAFAAIWGNFDERLKVMHFPSIEKAILDKYKRGKADFEIDEREAGLVLTRDKEKTAGTNDVEQSNTAGAEQSQNETFTTPTISEKKSFFDFKNLVSPREHQENAINNFIQNEYKTLLAMATGSGKTLTSLFCANELSKIKDIFSILIIVPLKDLVDQWQKDIEKYFSGSIIPIRSGLEWKEKLSDLSIQKLLKNKISNQTASNTSEKLVLITTYDSFCLNNEKILNSLDISKTIIIADEVHKFGAESYSKKLPEEILYRIGLSATPKRAYDDKGTKAIFDYFCPSEKPFEFTIEEAISKNMLCHYNYYPILVQLTDDENENYEILSEKISKIIAYQNNSENVTKEEKQNLEQLLKERHRIIERVENKKDAFIDCMVKEICKYKDKTLVFAPDGKNENNEDYLSIYKTELFQALMKKGKIVSMAEYVQGTDKSVIENFSKGAINLLFAKQRLNEGIDIPSTKRAFFIASSTSEREFIQRRGRVLRNSPETNKKNAEIFDLIVIPPDKNSFYAKSIIDNELKRAIDFAKTADNYAEIENILRGYL